MCEFVEVSRGWSTNSKTRLNANYYVCRRKASIIILRCSKQSCASAHTRVFVPTSHQKLSPGEFEILKILWKLDSATVAQVREASASERRVRPAYTTTMTLLGRLVDKDAVRVNRAKQPYQYRPAMRRTTLLRRRLREFVEVCYEGDSELLMEDLIGEGHLHCDTALRVVADSKEQD